jgi:hypothetical protein
VWRGWRRRVEAGIAAHPPPSSYLYFSPVFDLFRRAALLQTVCRGLDSSGTTPTLVGPSAVQEDSAMMNLLEHDGQSATIQLGQRELLLVMALIQEGRESFGCDTDTGKALDQFFCSANVLVEETRRKQVSRSLMRQKVTAVLVPDPAPRKDVSNA